MYQADDKRYEKMKYNRCGNSGLMLPAVSLGFWHNFGSSADYENMRRMCQTAFDLGITHFDLANNYGPVPGSAEENLGRILKQDFLHLRIAHFLEFGNIVARKAPSVNWFVGKERSKGRLFQKKQPRERSFYRSSASCTGCSS